MSDLNNALMMSKFDEVRSLLASGAAWDVPDYQTDIAISNMLRRGAYDLIKILIDKNVIDLDVFEYDKFNKTIFKHILDTKYSDELYDFVEDIIGDIENIDEELEGKSWLGLAIEKNSHPKLIELLMNNGCDVNKINRREETYLFSTKDLTLSEMLINSGLDINKKNIVGRTAFFNVVASKDKELIQLYLDNGVDVNAQDNRGETVYNIVCFNIMDSGDIFSLLANFDPPQVNLKNKDGESIFMKIASRVERESEINLLNMMLEYGGDLFQEELDTYGNPTTASNLIAKKPVTVLENIAEKGYLDVDAIDARGNTWLHQVCMFDINFDEKEAKELYRKVKFLLKQGANPSLKNDVDKSPIDYAQEDNLKAKALQIMLKK